MLSDGPIMDLRKASVKTGLDSVPSTGLHLDKNTIKMLSLSITHKE